jgi:hypothetical protein
MEEERSSKWQALQASSLQTQLRWQEGHGFRIRIWLLSCLPPLSPASFFIRMAN